MSFNLISSVLFVALNKEGVKNVLHLHQSQCKIAVHRFIKYLLFSSKVKTAILKKIKVASIEPSKQTLSL